MAEVKVLIEGTNAKDEQHAISMSSSVTLIKSDKNILVDTGSIPMKKRLIEQLEKQGLTPEDIHIVVLTHLHLDHIINVHLFFNANILCKVRGGEYPGQAHILSEGCLTRTDLFDHSPIAEDVETMVTPGHTDDMLSVVVKTPEGTVVIAGDAIPDKEWIDLNIQPSPVLNLDVNAFNQSRQKILEKADYIVPGHGTLFKV